MSGSARIRTGAGDKSRRVDVVGEGEFFGGMALIDDEPRSATCAARKNLTCAVFTRDEIRTRIEGANFLTQGLPRLATRRLRKTTHSTG